MVQSVQNSSSAVRPITRSLVPLLAIFFIPFSGSADTGTPLPTSRAEVSLSPNQPGVAVAPSKGAAEPTTDVSELAVSAAPQVEDEEKTCLWVAAWEGCSIQDGINRRCARRERDAPERGSIEKSKLQTSCIERRLSELCDEWNASVVNRVRSTQTGGLRCVLKGSAGAITLGEVLRLDLAGAKGMAGKPASNQMFLEGYFLGDDCHYRDPGVPARICGFGGASWSPISLMWEGEVDLQANSTVVRFPLAPDKKGTFSLWRASEQAPLLVFDPGHKGEISSPEQLLGNFSFGGRRRDSTLSKVEGEKAGYPLWENGYAALERLDIDQDGKVSGSELEPLGLWFDRLRDGVSGPGEVVPLATQGVVALYYRGAKPARSGRELRIDVGFERIVDGVLKKGASVDWYSESFSSEREAVQALGPVMRGGSKYFNESLAPYGDDWKTKPLEFAPSLTDEQESNLSGFWIWRLVSENGFESPGVLAFEQLGDGALKGYSVIETPLALNPAALKSAIKMLPLRGRVERDPKGDIFYSFVVTEPESGMVASSNGYLSDKGETLTGETTQAFHHKGSDRSATISYRWMARKLVQKEVEEESP